MRSPKSLLFGWGHWAHTLECSQELLCLKLGKEGSWWRRLHQRNFSCVHMLHSCRNTIRKICQLICIPKMLMCVYDVSLEWKCTGDLNLNLIFFMFVIKTLIQAEIVFNISSYLCNFSLWRSLPMCILMVVKHLLQLIICERLLSCALPMWLQHQGYFKLTYILYFLPIYLFITSPWRLYFASVDLSVCQRYGVVQGTISLIPAGI